MMNETILRNVMISSGKFDKEEAYWLEKLSGELSVSSFSYNRRGTESPRGDRAVRAFQVPADIVPGLMRVGNSSPYGVFIVLVTVLNVLLAKYSGNRDIIIGTPVVKQEAAGNYLNRITAIRNRVEANGNTAVKDLLVQVKQAVTEAYANMNYPFSHIADPGFSLFDTLVRFKGIHEEGVVEEGTCGTVFSFRMEGDRVAYEIDYDAVAFDAAAVERLSGHLDLCLRTVTRNPRSLLSEIDILSPEEKHRLLEEFNAAASDFPGHKTIHRLFEEQVEKTPDRIAVVGDSCALPGTGYCTLTYGALNERAEGMARLLRDRGIGPGTIAALRTRQTVEMAAAIFAVLKAGGAYLPIDPGYPGDRVRYMMADSGAKVLITNGEKGSEEGENIFLENIENLLHAPCSRPRESRESTSLAYVIYTSGSTGLPKGVLVEHRSLVNLCYWHNEEFSVTTADRASKYAGIGFDASVWEIFPYLIVGAALYIVPEEIKLDIHRLNRFFESRHITIGFLPTQVCELFMKQKNRSLRILLTGGDKLKEFREKSYRLVNNYGPTENTVVATCFPMDANYRNIPIGKPISNSRVTIVDSYDRLQPVGVPGELCISGAGLARGYLNRPELTIKSFVGVQGAVFQKSPLAAGASMLLDPIARPGIFPTQRNASQALIGSTRRVPAGGRLYKTGDLARWLPDGNIEFLGRMDTQVKVRGYRIELGEIENQLLTHKEIEAAVVVAKSDPRGGNENYLCAYFVPGDAGGQGPEETLLKEYLSRTLPHYMVPASFVTLERMPLTASGKVDRKSLLNRKETRPGTRAAYVAPGTYMETLIADTWKEVLRLEEVGIHDNFFDLGGNSFDIIKVNSQLQAALEKEFPVVKMFKYPTVSTLANYLTHGEPGEFSPEKEQEMAEKLDKGKGRLKERARRRKRTKNKE
ncbi:MAG: amino acid adenylation domain-containing protein [bacterium]|nr:amino acid adenylation domain-containing protein [bacterium]